MSLPSTGLGLGLCSAMGCPSYTVSWRLPLSSVLTAFLWAGLGWAGQPAAGGV